MTTWKPTEAEKKAAAKRRKEEAEERKRRLAELKALRKAIKERG